MLGRTMSLYVMLVEAQNLYPAGKKSGFCDAYAVLALNQTRCRSHTAKHTLNPAWHEQFAFGSVTMDDFLTVTVHHSSTIGTPALLGALDIPLCAVGDGRVHDELYPLERAAGMHGPASGAVRLVLLCAPRGTDPVLTPAARAPASPPLVHFGCGRIAVEILDVVGSTGAASSSSPSPSRSPSPSLSPSPSEHEPSSSSSSSSVHFCTVHLGEQQRARTEPACLRRAEPWKDRVFYFEGDSHAVLTFRLKELVPLRPAVLVGTGTLALSTVPAGTPSVHVVPLSADDTAAASPESTTSTSSDSSSVRSLKVRVTYTPAQSIPETEIVHSRIMMNCSDVLFDPLPPPRETWAPEPVVRAPAGALVAVDEALQRACHVEDSRAAVTRQQQQSADDVFDETCAFPFYARFFYGTPFRLYVSDAGPDVAALQKDTGSVGHVLVTVAPSDECETQLRVIVWTKHGAQRLVVPNIAGHLRIIQGLCPLISACRFRDCTSIASGCQDDLLEYERLRLRRHHKVGVYYCAPGQHAEAEFIGNETATPAFEHFLTRLGTRVELRGWQYFRGGLDTTANRDGTHSVYTTYKDIEVMFHVCQLLPHSRTDKHQVARKRHLGNDPVIVIFKERAPQQQDPQQQPDVVDITTIRSQWNHVFIIVSPEGDGNSSGSYRVNAVYKAGVEPAAPYVPETSLLLDDDSLHDWLLRKSLLSLVRSHLFCLLVCIYGVFLVVQSSTPSAVRSSRRCSGRVPSALLWATSRPLSPSVVCSRRPHPPPHRCSRPPQHLPRPLAVCSTATPEARSTAAPSLPVCPDACTTPIFSLSPTVRPRVSSASDCSCLCVCVCVCVFWLLDEKGI